MKKLYRRRFIMGAMLAFTILVIVLIAGTLLLNYQQMERASDSFMKSIFYPREELVPEDPPQLFGYRIGTHKKPFRCAAYEIDPQGKIQTVQTLGMDESAEGIEAKLMQLWQSHAESAKLDAFKIRLYYEEDGSAKAAVLDNTANVQSLYHMLRSSLVMGGLSILLMLLILLPVSNRIANINLKNIERQNRFITNAGHDLKTPIAIILTNLDAMELIEGGNKWSKNIRSQAVRLKNLTEALLSLSRANEAIPEGRMETADIAELVRQQADTFSEGMRMHALTVRIGGQSPLYGRIYRDSMQQLLHILFDNAVRYAEENSRIIVTLKSDSSRIRMEMMNRIQKKPCEDPEELFTRFYRGDEARNQASGGYGIGLSAARSIIETHHGRITASYPDEKCVCIHLEWKK